MSDLLEREPESAEARFDRLAMQSAERADAALPMPAKVPPLPKALDADMIGAIEKRLDGPKGTRLRDAACKAIAVWERRYQGVRGPTDAELSTVAGILRAPMEREAQRTGVPVDESEVATKLKRWAESTKAAFLVDRPRRFFDELERDRPGRIPHFEKLVAQYLAEKYGGTARHDAEGRLIGLGSLHRDAITGRFSRQAASDEALFAGVGKSK